jgi:hypothetical protein
MQFLPPPPKHYHALEEKRVALEWFHYITEQATDIQLLIECAIRKIPTQGISRNTLQGELLTRRPSTYTSW